MKKRTIQLGEKELPVRWSNRSTFRMSAMGFQNYDQERQLAYAVAMVAAAIDTPKQVYSPEQIFEMIGEDEEALTAAFETVMEAFEEAVEGKPQKPKKSGRTTALKSA